MTVLLASVAQNLVELARKLTGRQPIIIDPATL
jgi:hypothetical protein